ncbi:30S ribosomal protein S14 [Lentisphaera profundi]|uniref:Small ribosomal subunit protein uS14 n=1 Tax=Lentisphaera profundi TaxID=1658616 RepID=A0ABY7VVM9_9BACT|nr:30S ribosomal protein S14 [Lentisphaera profundi]WDE98285.1 30S ribosomal protein S14 [Lentisphaera profundi]
MAKKSWIQRNEKKAKVVAKYAERRAALKKAGDYAGLSNLPRNASPTRVVNRCSVTGRKRAYYRKFGVSRLTLRELASQGLVPGMRRASW